MSEYLDIFAEVIRLATFQPREARMRYEPRWEERFEFPDRKKDGPGTDSQFARMKDFL